MERGPTLIISVLNNKGGTGKTTTSVNLAAAAAIEGKRTLLIDLASAEVELSSTPGREYILREALTPIKQDYDNIIIDCPPNIGLLTLNALVTSDLVLIPVQCEFYPMEGLPTLVKVMDL